MTILEVKTFRGSREQELGHARHGSLDHMQEDSCAFPREAKAERERHARHGSLGPNRFGYQTARPRYPPN